MKTARSLGVWMDHSRAHLIEYPDRMEIKVVEALPVDRFNDEPITRGESQMNRKEQHMLTAYYNELASVFKNYEEVVLFGPTNAKTELFNKLKDSNQFENVKITVKESDKMTENQQRAFVRDYFSKN